MSLPASVQRVNRPLLLVAALVSALAFSLGGTARGVAALLGATLAVGNWYALRWLGGRFVSGASGGAGSSTALSLLLIGKIGLLMAIVYVLIARVRVDPIGLALGLGVLFVGPVLAGLSIASAGSSQSADPAAARAAREER